MTEPDRYEQLLEAYRAGHPALTIELARLYLADHPPQREALLMLGNTLAEISRFDEGRAALEHALALSNLEERHGPLRSLGRLCDDQGAFLEAEAFYKQAIAAAPIRTTAYIFLGAMLARLGRLDEALAVHQQATQCVDGDRDEAFLNLGYVQRARGDYVGALVSFREALRLTPDYPAAREALDDIEAVLFRFPSA